MGRSRDSQHPATAHPVGSHPVGSHRAGSRRAAAWPFSHLAVRPRSAPPPINSFAPGAGPRYRSADAGGPPGVGRFALRGVAVLLLMLGLAGGAYLGKQAQIRPASLTVADTRAEAAELRMLDGLLEERERAEQERLAREREKAAREAREKRRAEEARRAREAEEAASRQQAESRSVPGVPSEPVGPVPESCEEFDGNRAIGCTLMVEAGFGMEHMPCLDDLWSHESGWNHLAQNPSSGAYGIPQALPGNKMATFGDDWETNPATQIRWGLSYISGRYGSPCDAWGFFQANGWY